MGRSTGRTTRAIEAMTIEVDGYQINVRISGTGEETVVILQGWGTQLSVYDSVAAALSERYRVVQFDFPGFGESEEPHEPWNVEAYADFFCKLLAALGISKAHLIGHSYGGRVIIRLAAREELPFSIGKIVLIDSAGVVPEKTPVQKRKMRRYQVLKKIMYNRTFEFLFPELVEDWRSRQGSADYRNATPIMRQCLVMAVNDDLRELFPKVTQETLLIWGDLDTATPLSDAKLMEERMPNAGLVVLPGTGHFSFLEQPDRFRSILRNFFGIGGAK